MTTKLGKVQGFEDTKKLEDKDIITSPEELARKIEEEKKDTKEEESADKQNASERINL